MKVTKFSAILFTIVAVLCICSTKVIAQPGKKVLTIEDIELWRSHNTTLSDNGEWYTVLYSLNEKPDEENGKKEAVDSANLDFYGEDARSDVLYIYNVKNGLKYSIEGGSRPSFSSSSKWIAYTVTKDNPDKSAKEKKITSIELRNLERGSIKVYESTARYFFPEDKEYFITSDKKSLLVYDLAKAREHYIGNIGEYLIDKDTDYIAYTISSEDKRGNGIYLYKPQDMTTMALETGNHSYSNLAWNSKKNSLAALKYNIKKDEVEHKDISIVLIHGIGSDKVIQKALPVGELTGMPEEMGIAVKSGKQPVSIRWSKDNNRLFIKLREYQEAKAEDKDKVEKKEEDESTVKVWHWKDKKLLSQRMKEADREKNRVYDAMVLLNARKVIELTNKEMQGLYYSRGTDKWAIVTDNKEYISDWNIRKVDLYRINLHNGEKDLITKGYAGSINISPDGSGVILWDDGHYWYYNMETGIKSNLTSDMEVSFIDIENDHYGSIRNYGFVGWIKDRDAIMVNHKLDLWILPLNSTDNAINLTSAITHKDKVRFRLDDMSFAREEKIEDRYIDLSTPAILSAFNIMTKYAGFYKLEEQGLKELIFEAASFGGSRWGSGLTKADKSDVIIYKRGDYKNYPESYLSNTDFKKAKKISNTNPQQKDYQWGHRILFDYTNDDGVPLQGVLSIPDNYKKGQKLPMVVYSYEKMSQGMYQHPTPRIGGASICEMLYVSDNYLYMMPDIHFNVGTPHSDMHECINAAIRKVIDLGYVDKDHIGYEGFSFGGHCGMYISTQKNRFAAIAAGAGVSNLVQGFNIDIVRDGSNEQDYYMVGQGRLGTDPTSNTDMYISESAVFNAAGMNTPLLLFHGTADEVVKWEHSFGYYSILRYLKKPVVFLSYLDEGHGLRKKSNRYDIQIRLKDYFDYYLKGKEAKSWMIEEIPLEMGEPKKDEKKRTVPPWK